MRLTAFVNVANTTQIITFGPFRPGRVPRLLSLSVRDNSGSGMGFTIRAAWVDSPRPVIDDVLSGQQLFVGGTLTFNEAASMSEGSTPPERHFPIDSEGTGKYLAIAFVESGVGNAQGAISITF